MANIRVGIFGATGEVGREIITVLDKTRFPMRDLTLYAGSSAGKEIKTSLGRKTVECADSADYAKLDLAFWAVGGEWSKNNRAQAEKFNCYIIDNSSAFRYEAGIPLVVPEVNGHVLRNYSGRIIANPNCTTAIAAIPLYVLHQMATVNNISFTTYQSASGAGNGGIEELAEQNKALLIGEVIVPNKFAHQLADNVIPHIDTFLDNEYTREEMKTNWETKKILGLSDSIPISSTCVRVPVPRSHSEDLLVGTQRPVNLDDYRAELTRTPGVAVFDDPSRNIYPMPINATNQYDVNVGRIRTVDTFPNGLRMFVSGDQLLRGAALNAGLIAYKLVDYGKI